MTTHVRCWQSDAAHQSKTSGRALRAQESSLWNIPHGIQVNPERGHTATWAVNMVLSCQRARATEKE
jgi:hypothetical protein